MIVTITLRYKKIGIWKMKQKISLEYFDEIIILRWSFQDALKISFKFTIISQIYFNVLCEKIEWSTASVSKSLNNSLLFWGYRIFCDFSKGVYLFKAFHEIARLRNAETTSSRSCLQYSKQLVSHCETKIRLGPWLRAATW